MARSKMATSSPSAWSTRENATTTALAAARGGEPSESAMNVSAERASSSRWPLTVANMVASGVPKCGVLMVVTLARRGSHGRGSSVWGTAANGVATSRASRPPVEWPTRCTTPAWPCSPSVRETRSLRHALRRRMDAVGDTSATYVRASSPAACNRSTSPRSRWTK